MTTTYAIPTFRRADRIVTVDTLRRHGVPCEAIQVWCSDPAEVPAYRDATGRTVDVRVGAPGVAANRAAIVAAQPPGTRLVQCDDDLKALLVKTADSKLRPLPVPFPDVVAEAFELADRAGCHMWGINAAANGGFMKHTATIGLRFCIGALYGTTVAATPCPCDLSASWPASGEDFRRTIECFLAHGAVARLDWLTVKTAYFATGGIDAALREAGIEHRHNDHAHQLRTLAATYPDLATAYTKAHGVVNLRLRNYTSMKYQVEPLL